MRSVVAAALVLLAAAGCGRQAPGPAEGTDSGVAGVVLVGPQCPVVTESSPCPDRPWIGTVRATRGDDVVEQATDDRGRFTLSLSPGRWSVAPVLRGNQPPSARPVSLQVSPHEFVDVTLTVDSGVR